MREQYHKYTASVQAIIAKSMYHLTMETIHISEAEAAANFAGLMARARAGAEVFIEDATSAVVVLRVAAEPRGRLLSESIALAKKHALELGYEPVMDAEFAADMEEIIRNRKPRGRL
jgi:antitoxin (DNA-binding transcriptional repressor) of toxin-antitoxin stability system